MCSSFAERYLFPPHDLIALAGITKQAGFDCSFTDAVAEKLSIIDVINEISEKNPDIIISILSFELYDQDVDLVKQIKSKYPNIVYGLFGHYPTHFPKETLQYSLADFIMLGEPDHIFENFLKKYSDTSLPYEIEGTVVRTKENEIVSNAEDRRVPNPNLLPMPAYELAKQKYYKEPFLPHPIGLIQTARGCPYKCNYCVHSFGTKLTVLSPENVIEHILYLKRVHNIQALRFIDDTFTAIPSRVIKICKLMIENNIDLKWTCLSRADTLNEEMLFWLKKAGCIRLNIGMESGSQKVLDILDKGMEIQLAEFNLNLVRKIGIQMMGFFLTGVPGETTEDINASIEFAKKHFDYIAVDTLKIYPGTPLFEKFSSEISFSLMPYQNNFKDEKFQKLADDRRSEFYRKFYFSFNFLQRVPKQNLISLSNLKTMIPYVVKLVLQK